MAELKEGMVTGAMNLYFIYKFLRILTTPWEKTEAFELGIIDDNGNILKKKKSLKSIKEKEAYTMMHRLVWKLKRLMEKVPFGKTRLASYAAALWLIKEGHSFKGDDKQLQESVLDFIESDWENEARILKEKYEGDLSKKTYNEFFTLGVSKPTKQDIQRYLDQLGNAVRLVSNKDIIKNIKNHFKTIKSLKLSSNGRQVLAFEEFEDVEEVAPPGWEGTVKAMKKNKKINNPYALAWWMKNKGMKPHIPEQDELEAMLEEMDPTDHVSKNDETGMWCVYNKNGDKVQEFDSEEEANKWAIDNHDELMEQANTSHVYVGIRSWDKTSNLRPSIRYGSGKTKDLILIKPIESDFFNENLKQYINSPYDFLEELRLHINFQILIKDKGAEKKMVDAIVKRKPYLVLGYNGDSVYAVDKNENKLKQTLQKYKVDEVVEDTKMVKQGENKMIKFSDFLTEGRPKLDPDYVPSYTTTDKQRATLVAAQQQKYTLRDIEALARKYKVKLDGTPAGGKDWDWDWQIAVRGGIVLGYEYRSNSMSVSGWKWDNKKVKKYIDKWEPEHSTPRDMKPMGGKILLRGFETAFDLIGLGEDFVSIGDVLDQVVLEAELQDLAEEIQKLEERRQSYSNFIPFPQKVLTDFAKRAKKSGMSFDQYEKFVKGTFKDGADSRNAIIFGREIFKDKEDGRKKFSGAQAKKDNEARRAAQRKRLGLEEVEIEENVILAEEVSVKDYNSLKKGDIITIDFKSAMSTGKSTFRVTAKNIVGKAKVGKVTLQNTKNPKGIKHYLYKRGNKVSFAQGDMGASVVKYAIEELEDEGSKKRLKATDEEAPANNTLGVDMTPHLKRKRGRKKVETEEFGGNKVFVVSSQRWHDSRLGKARYSRYDKYVGNDSIGNAIREYGRGNPKAPIILKNSQTGAMLYLKYGSKRK